MRSYTLKEKVSAPPKLDNNLKANIWKIEKKPAQKGITIIIK
jgi:hypothetical protein